MSFLLQSDVLPYIFFFTYSFQVNRKSWPWAHCLYFWSVMFYDQTENVSIFHICIMYYDYEREQIVVVIIIVSINLVFFMFLFHFIDIVDHHFCLFLYRIYPFIHKENVAHLYLLITFSIDFAGGFIYGIILRSFFNYSGLAALNSHGLRMILELLLSILAAYPHCLIHRVFTSSLTLLIYQPMLSIHMYVQ